MTAPEDGAPQPTQLNTRDLVIGLHARFDEWKKAELDYRERNDREVAALKERLTAIERSADRQEGAFKGAKYLFEFLRALPVAGVAYFFGSNR